MKIVCVTQKQGITAGNCYEAEEIFVLTKDKRKKTYHIENDQKEEKYYWPEYFMSPEDYRNKIIEEIGIV